MPDVSAYLLLYGPDEALQREALDSLFRALPAPQRPYASVWCNVVSPHTLRLLEDLPYTVYESAANVPKYVAMRKMFAHGVTQPWILWLDDDTRMLPGWWEATENYLKAKQAENVCLVGQGWYSHDLEWRRKFVMESAWWRGREWSMHRGRIQCHFPSGGYWWLRRDVRDLLDWPDPRLSHNGGDTLLAEAVRQQGLPFHAFAGKVKTQILGAGPSGRRGINERPAGMAGSVLGTDYHLDLAQVKIWKGQGK